MSGIKLRSKTLFLAIFIRARRLLRVFAIAAYHVWSFRDSTVYKQNANKYDQKILKADQIADQTMKVKEF